MYWNLVYEIKDITKNKFLPCFFIFVNWVAVLYAALYSSFMCWTWKKMFYKYKSLGNVVHVTVISKYKNKLFTFPQKSPLYPRTKHIYQRTLSWSLFMRWSMDILIISDWKKSYFYTFCWNNLWKYSFHWNSIKCKK